MILTVVNGSSRTLVYWYAHNIVFDYPNQSYSLTLTAYFSSDKVDIPIVFRLSDDRLSAFLPDDPRSHSTIDSLSQGIQDYLRLSSRFPDKVYTILSHSIPELTDIHISVYVMDLSSLFQMDWVEDNDGAGSDEGNNSDIVSLITGFRDNFAVYTLKGIRISPTKEQVKAMSELPSYRGIQNLLESNGYQSYNILSI